MSKRIKPAKPLPVQRWDDGIKGTAAPKYAVLPTTRRDESIPAHPFDAIPARRKREAGLDHDGVVRKSGKDKPLSIIKRNGIDKYKSNKNAKYGSVAQQPTFDREAKRGGND